MENNCKSFRCTVGTYELAVELSDAMLSFHVYSDYVNWEFQGKLVDGYLPEEIRHKYGDSRTVYGLIQKAAAAKRVVLNENGDLKFRF